MREGKEEEGNKEREREILRCAWEVSLKHWSGEGMQRFSSSPGDLWRYCPEALRVPEFPVVRRK